MAIHAKLLGALVGLLGAAFCLSACSGDKTKSSRDKQQAIFDARTARKVVKKCGKMPLLRWPLRGRDWVINNYVDLDPTTAATRDYTRAIGADAKTYDGHRGVDIDISSFRQMDANTSVLAATAGTVIEVDDTHPDRNTKCAGKWNYVSVRDASGYVLIYGHLKRGSATVARGKRINAGAVIGLVGSSGCSTQPHLHLEVTDCNGALVSPFEKRMWKSAHAYSPPLRVLDVMIRPGGHDGVATLKDPSPNPTSVRSGRMVGFGLSAAGGQQGDTLGFAIHQPNGERFRAPARTFGKAQRHTYWYWNITLPIVRGKWLVKVMVNGVAVRELALVVRR